MAKKLPIRKANRLPDYDYSTAGYYFVTINIKDKSNHFGDVIDGKMKLNGVGMIADHYWEQIPDHYTNVKLDEYVIMPNHIHGIIIISGVKRTAQCAVPTDNRQEKRHNRLSTVIRTYKTLTGREIRKTGKSPDFTWQRSFYDHVIRNNEALMIARQYIQDNPLKWHLDEYFAE
ncbi:MAG: transposase [candidate division Zixibacteria bacterium]|nr:transposase [candidate division Zixibacteria bacterium]